MLSFFSSRRRSHVLFSFSPFGDGELKCGTKPTRIEKRKKRNQRRSSRLSFAFFSFLRCNENEKKNEELACPVELFDDLNHKKKNKSDDDDDSDGENNKKC